MSGLDKSLHRKQVRQQVWKGGVSKSSGDLKVSVTPILSGEVSGLDQSLQGKNEKKAAELKVDKQICGS